MREPEMMQTVILHLKDGRKLYFSGRAGLTEGDEVVRIEALQPAPLPEGMEFTDMEMVDEPR